MAVGAAQRDQQGGEKSGAGDAGGNSRPDAEAARCDDQGEHADAVRSRKSDLRRRCAQHCETAHYQRRDPHERRHERLKHLRAGPLAPGFDPFNRLDEGAENDAECTGRMKRIPDSAALGEELHGAELAEQQVGRHDGGYAGKHEQREFGNAGMADYEAWQKRDLSARRYVYVWADGVYL
jgi:hypothetical protein